METLLAPARTNWWWTGRQRIPLHAVEVLPWLATVHSSISIPPEHEPRGSLLPYSSVLLLAKLPGMLLSTVYRCTSPVSNAPFSSPSSLDCSNIPLHSTLTCAKVAQLKPGKAVAIWWLYSGAELSLQLSDCASSGRCCASVRHQRRHVHQAVCAWCSDARTTASQRS